MPADSATCIARVRAGTFDRCDALRELRDRCGADIVAEAAARSDHFVAGALDMARELSGESALSDARTATTQAREDMVKRNRGVVDRTPAGMTPHEAMIDRNRTAWK